jgi:hypothetical protein
MDKKLMRRVLEIIEWESAKAIWRDKRKIAEMIWSEPEIRMGLAINALTNFLLFFYLF